MAVAAAAAAADDCCSAAGVAAPVVPTVVAAAAVVVAAAAAGAVDDAYGDDFGRLVVLWLSVVPSAIEYRQTSLLPGIEPRVVPAYEDPALLGSAPS